jgi:hypothetical protein
MERGLPEPTRRGRAMPNRMLLIGLAVASLALTACGAAYNPNDLYGTPLPSPTPTPVTTPNPTLTAALVTIAASGSALASQPVNLYTDVSGHLGSLIVTQDTNTSGQTTFSGLTAAQNYCFNSTYTPTTAGSLPQNETICTDLWGFGVTMDF